MEPENANRAKANILCVTTYKLGGESASTRVLGVAGALRDLGHRVTVHQHVQRGSDTSIADLGDRDRDIAKELIVSSRPASFVRHLSSILRQDFDIVIGNNMNGALYSILGLVRAPLVLDLHGDMVAELDMYLPADIRRPPLGFRLRKAGYELTEVITRKLANGISCVSHRMISLLRDRGVPADRLYYVPNCVDLDFFKPKPAERAKRSALGLNDDAFVLGYLGRVHPWQGLNEFAEAARSVGDPRLAFLIVGTDDAAVEGNVRFTGPVPRSEMPDLYSACDAFVLPRPSHPATEVAAPTKFAEYAAMGRPIIASRVGDAADLIQSYDCGTVVEDNSPAELIRGFHQMSRSSAERRTEMAANARKLAECEFSIEVARRSLSQCINALTT